MGELLRLREFFGKHCFKPNLVKNENERFLSSADNPAARCFNYQKQLMSNSCHYLSLNQQKT